MEVNRIDLDGYNTRTVICSHFPKQLSVVTSLDIGIDGCLKDYTVFEVTFSELSVLITPYIETAFKKYNELPSG